MICEAVKRPKRRIVGFAGGGGSSIAIMDALGVHPDAALNHWPLALSVHEANFPATAHYCADIFDTDCRDIFPGDDIELLWMSPDCRHFSKAKGGAPVSDRVRGLAWAVIPWAKFRKPDVIMVENVEEFVTWAPLIFVPGKGRVPDPDRKGETFRRWVSRLRQCGYVVEWQVSSAASYGDPTIRKRLLIICRRDGFPIIWPAPTHAPRQAAQAKGLKAYRSAADDVIDWSRPCPSIFMSSDDARVLRIKRPLEAATLARIAKGLFRYTIACADPFIVPVTHGGDQRTYDVRDPLRTVTTAKRGEMALIAPILTGCGGRLGQTEPKDLREPYSTVTSKNDSALACAYMTKFSENSTGYSPREPLHTVMAGAPRHGLVSAFMEQANTGMVGHDARSPISTIVGRGTTQRLVTAQLSQFRGSNRGQGDPRQPVGTLTAGGGHQAVLQATLDHDQAMAVPFTDPHPQLRAFLIKYYGSATAADIADPFGAVTARARFGLVVVQGVAWRIVDIGMRMLDPETELAAAMGVPKNYRLGWDAAGNRVSKTNITKMVGNMVCRRWASAHIAANLRRSEPERAAA